MLIAHGMSFLIRARSREIPLDRSNSILELNVSGKGGLTGTDRRVREGYYDKIYLNSEWYSPELRDHPGELQGSRQDCRPRRSPHHDGRASQLHEVWLPAPPPRDARPGTGGKYRDGDWRPTLD